MVPFAHCLNHTHLKDTGMFLINTMLHADPLIDKSYFEGPKFLTDSRVFYQNCKDEELKQKAENNDLVQGFQVTESFKAHNDEKSVIGWHLYIKSEKT